MNGRKSKLLRKATGSHQTIKTRVYEYRRLNPRKYKTTCVSTGARKLQQNLKRSLRNGSAEARAALWNLIGAEAARVAGHAK